MSIWNVFRKANSALILVSSIVLMSVIVTAVPVSAAEPLREEIGRYVDEDRGFLIDVRRDLHMHPEVSGQEKRTAREVARLLRELGLDVETGVGGYGVVGILKGRLPGPVVAYRADMDAIDSDDPDVVPFKSVNAGVRHICGHDVHIAVALGIARALNKVRDELPGTVKFIFQPAEEVATGAKAMIDAGVLMDPKPDAIFAVHSAPLEAGQIGYVFDQRLPGLDLLTVTLKGSGDLAPAADAYSAVLYETSTVPALESLTNKTIWGEDQEFTGQIVDPGVAKPRDFIYSGIWDSTEIQDENKWILRGFVRASSEVMYASAKQLIADRLSLIEGYGVEYELEYEDGIMPDTINDRPLVKSTLQTLRSVVGESNSIFIQNAIPYFGEDFSYYQQVIPGALYWLGVANTELGIGGMPHAPDFSVDEEAIIVGTKTMANIIVDYLQNGSPDL